MHFMRVHYTDGMHEKYYFDHPLPRRYRFWYVLQAEDSFLRTIPKIWGEFETDPLNPKHQNHFVVKREDLNKASFIERRVLYHTLVKRFMDFEHLRSEYPTSILENDLDKLKNTPTIRYIKNGSFMIFPLSGKPMPGMRVLEHYFDYLTTFQKSNLLCAMNFIYRHRKIMNLTTDAILRRVRWYKSHTMYHAAGYAAILQRLKIDGPVIDMHPELGHKALACWKLGLPYCPVKNDAFEVALERGFGDLTGLEILDPNEIDRAAIVLSDHNFTQHTLDLTYANKAKHLLAFVKFEEREDLPIKAAKMFKFVKSKIDHHKKEHDYLAFW